MTKTIKNITEVPCVCKGGSFTERNGRFHCPKCNLWVGGSILGHKITPQDLHDMLYGDRIADGTRWTEDHKLISNRTKKPFTAALGFKPDTNYDIGFKFPPREPKAEVVQTGKLCPDCLKANRNGLLVIRTSTKGENAGRQFLGCTKYPECKYREDYVATGPYQGVSDQGGQDSPPAAHDSTPLSHDLPPPAHDPAPPAHAEPAMVPHATDPLAMPPTPGEGQNY